MVEHIDQHPNADSLSLIFIIPTISDLSIFLRNGDYGHGPITLINFLHNSFLFQLVFFSSCSMASLNQRALYVGGTCRSWRWHFALAWAWLSVFSWFTKHPEHFIIAFQHFVQSCLICIHSCQTNRFLIKVQGKLILLLTIGYHHLHFSLELEIPLMCRSSGQL